MINPICTRNKSGRVISKGRKRNPNRHSNHFTESWSRNNFVNKPAPKASAPSLDTHEAGIGSSRCLPIRSISKTEMARTYFPNGIKTRPLEAADVRDVAPLHLQAFPHAAISQLGVEAAWQYYNSVIDGRHQATGVGAFHQGRLLGYCFAGVWNDPEKYFLKTNMVFIARRVLIHPTLLLAPFFRERILCGVRLLWPKRQAHAVTSLTPVDADETKPVRSWGILYLAVDHEARGLGLGHMLLEQIENLGRQKGFQQLNLSVYLDNHAAITLYEHMGWEKLLSDGIWKGFMIKSLL